MNTSFKILITIIVLLALSALFFNTINQKNTNRVNVGNNDDDSTQTGEYVENNSSIKDSEYYKNKGYQVFDELGFAIKAPCVLKDVSSQTQGDVLLSYGGVSNVDDPRNRTFYQLMAVRLPIGFKDIPAEELGTAIDNEIRSRMKALKNCKRIIFGYEKYAGYVGECTTKGYKQKGVMFSKDNYIICLNVISNVDLEEKFNKFTNEFKTIGNQSSEGEMKVQVLQDIGYAVVVPCTLKEADMTGIDYYYWGAIDESNKDKAIVYKITVNKLPVPYSQMGISDKKTIKTNLINYLQTKGQYEKCGINLSNHFAYVVNSTEEGFNVRECLMLTDIAVVEFIVFSKKDIESDFDNFIQHITSID